MLPLLAARIREILENVGLAQESLPSNVVASTQVLANVANLLNIRDTELSRCVCFTLLCYAFWNLWSVLVFKMWDLFLAFWWLWLIFL